MIAFFFFFFQELYNVPVVQKAFKSICLDKMLSDGYFDMSVYIFGRIKKESMLNKLVFQDSRYVVLYNNPYPTQNTAVETWEQLIGKHTEYNNENTELSFTESEAIVNWVYRTIKSSMERENFTKELLRNIKSLHGVNNDIEYSQGVVYNSKKVEIHFISSISALNTLISTYTSDGKCAFYRGHTNANYTLLPTVMRTKKWHENERVMYNELIISCPEDFESCHTHFEKLVKMQHYGLPTRLLDITRNPLVAMYFACKNRFNCYGEVVILSADEKNIKYPQSDTVSILSGLSLLPYREQEKLKRLAKDASISKAEFNEKAARLMQEIRLEKPAFSDEIDKRNLLDCFVVYALKNNNRIIKQDGAFILCGLLDRNNSPNKFKLRENGRVIIALVDNKEEILNQLEHFSINHATLFPEIECVSEYIKHKYDSPKAPTSD